jgi:ICP0-binding domain of Ubiquitin-specific protease 7/Ubiquitin carboxyl-terminal hydrolase
LEIDLSDFLATSADRSVPCNYHLHGVLVHSGDVHGGHYFGMIKPGKDQKWYRYDDERVIPVTLSDVLEENFGGESTPTSTTMSALSISRLSRHAAQWKRFTSAYMLVYFRESALDEILAPITEADVPSHVVNTVHAEREEAMRVKREKDEEHLFINVRVIDVESFRHHEGVDLANFDASDREAAKWVHVFRIKKDLTWAAFYESLRKSFGIEEGHEIRVWNLVNRQNRTVRPDVPVPPDPNLCTLPPNPPVMRSGLTVLAIEAWLVSVTTKGDIKLYLERSDDVWHPTIPNLPKRITPLSPPLPIPPPAYHDDSSKDNSPLLQFSHSSSRSNGDFDHQANGTGFDWPEVGKVQGVYNSRHDAVMILIFLKWFDVDGQRLLGKTPVYVHRQHKTGTLTPIIAEMMGWRSEVGESPVQISLFEEIKPGMIEPLKPNASYIACEIQDGDIICYMRGISSKRYPTHSPLKPLFPLFGC